MMGKRLDMAIASISPLSHQSRDVHGFDVADSHPDNDATGRPIHVSGRFESNLVRSTTILRAVEHVSTRESRLTEFLRRCLDRDNKAESVMMSR